MDWAQRSTSPRKHALEYLFLIITIPSFNTCKLILYITKGIQIIQNDLDTTYYRPISLALLSQLKCLSNSGAERPGNMKSATYL